MVFIGHPNFVRICGIEIYIDESTIGEWIEPSCPKCKKKNNGFGFKSPDKEWTVWQCDRCHEILAWK